MKRPRCWDTWLIVFGAVMFISGLFWREIFRSGNWHTVLSWLGGAWEWVATTLWN